MTKYSVYGMSCAACSSRVEKAVSKVEGVNSVAVNLLTNSMIVEGEVEPEIIMKAVEDAGYKAKPQNGEKAKSEEQTDELDNSGETKKIRNRFIWSIIFLVPLMYISMGVTMWRFPAPEAFEKNHIAMGLTEMLFTIIIMIINKKFFVSGLKGLINKAPNMDTLVALGSGASFGYSLYVLYAMTFAQVDGNMELVHHYMHEFYFESAAMILTLITVGKMLEAYSKGKTTNALKGLMDLAPKTAVLFVDGEEKEVPVEQVKKGDVYIVRPGADIPVDGVVLEGDSAVDESALTGESIPVDKAAGDGVSAGTINQSGVLRCEAARVGEDTALSKIIQMVSDAAATKAPIAKIADRVSGIFVPAVVTIAVVTIIVWLLAGQSVGFALARGISVLVISCPCALGLATPVAIMVANGVGARNGILFKTAVSMEETGKTAIVALDKTGTITKGEPRVTDLLPAENILEQQLLEDAYHLEQMSEHPLAKAVLDYGTQKGVSSKEVSDFKAHPGNGLSAVCDGVKLMGGSVAYISSQVQIPQEVQKQAQKLAGQGKTPLCFVRDESYIGMIAVADVMKEDSPQAIRELQNMGIHVVMLTGDNRRTAEAIGAQAGVDQVVADVLPDGKESVIRELQKFGKVAMVGDGINDAPALTRADMGIAIGAGTDVAIDAADVVLMKSRLSDVPAAIRLSRAALRNIHENLFWAFFYNVIGIPLAAGVWIPLFGWKLNPMFGAAAMSLSSFCVVTNALRLNLFRIHDAGRERKRKDAICVEFISDNNDNKKEEVETMTKTIKIEGMMCGHCEAHVKKALEAIDGVTEAVASHEKGTAVVTLEQPVEDDVLTKAVEEQDYKVVSVE